MQLCISFRSRSDLVFWMLTIPWIFWAASFRVPQKEVGKRSSITFFRFRDTFGLTFSDVSVNFFVTLLPDSFCRTPFAGLLLRLFGLLVSYLILQACVSFRSVSDNRLQKTREGCGCFRGLLDLSGPVSRDTARLSQLGGPLKST